MQTKLVSVFQVFSVISLWVLCLGSSLAVVYSSYQARQANQQLEVLKREAAGLKIEAGRYLLEDSTLSSYARVERIAKRELDMLPPNKGDTVLIYQ